MRRIKQTPDPKPVVQDAVATVIPELAMPESIEDKIARITGLPPSVIWRIEYKGGNTYCVITTDTTKRYLEVT